MSTSMDAESTLLRQRLPQLYPLNQLGEDILSRLLPALLIEPCAAGTTLYDAGDSPTENFYVLQGCVCLFDADGTPLLRIRPEPNYEATPLPYDLPSHERALVTEDSIILHVERRLLAQAVERRGAFAAPGAAIPGSALPAPAHSVAESSPPVAEAPAQAVPAPAKPRRVLIVEHRPVEAERTRAVVKALGRRSDWARSAEEAVELLQIEQYGAVLLDLQLPDGDALDVVKCIRAYPAHAPHPVLIAVTDPSHYDPEGCTSLGMDDACCLPLSADALRARLDATHAGDRRRLEAA